MVLRILLNIRASIWFVLSAGDMGTEMWHALQRSYQLLSNAPMRNRLKGDKGVEINSKFGPWMVFKKNRSPKKAKGVEGEEEKKKEGKKKENNKKGKGKDVEGLEVGTSRYLALAGLGEDDEELTDSDNDSMGLAENSPTKNESKDETSAGERGTTQRRDGLIKGKVVLKPNSNKMKIGMGSTNGISNHAQECLQPGVDIDSPMASHDNDPLPDPPDKFVNGNGDTCVPCTLGNDIHNEIEKVNAMDLDSQVQHFLNKY